MKSKPHGGAREGSGRPAELIDPQKILVTLEKWHTQVLDDYAEKRQLRGRSAALRKILDRYIKK